MQPSPNHAPWQVGPVSATGGVAAAALALLAVDSVFTWPVTPYLIVAPTLTAVPAVVAIRVIRGFRRSRELAATTLTSILVVASMAFYQLAGQARAAVVVAIALAASGLLGLAVDGFRDRLGAKPAITTPRWPTVAVALRRPSRYRSRRQYR